MLSSPAVAAGRAMQTNSFSDEDDSGTINRINVEVFLATSVFRIPAQFKQQISGKVLGVLLTPYSWQ